MYRYWRQTVPQTIRLLQRGCSVVFPLFGIYSLYQIRLSMDRISYVSRALFGWNILIYDFTIIKCTNSDNVVFLSASKYLLAVIIRGSFHPKGGKSCGGKSFYIFLYFRFECQLIVYVQTCIAFFLITIYRNLINERTYTILSKKSI